ncbi:hypothetical protein [Ponticaulis sp.]|uniref:hypothetical protein n=1 Tax=Ponticaulis sp. TaxID=2020902 RepID=UPI002607373F|nr:hypothetical protein [Ponticaulis sp.]MDF1679672.1 hypothetical protein [Ponticaulis sp.]
MTKTRHIGLIAALSISLMGAAHAQDSATVDATVTLEQSVPPLALTGQSSLNFGAVNIPNGTETGHSCHYNVGVSGATPTYQLYEYSETDTLTDTTVPTPSGCNWGSASTPDASYGVFAVTCNPASTVDFTTSWTNGVATGVNLEAGTGTVTQSFSNSDLSSTLASGSSAGGMSATCPADGDMYVAIGGRLVVQTTASAGTDVLVGTVTLDAAY